MQPSGSTSSGVRQYAGLRTGVCQAYVLVCARPAYWCVLGLRTGVRQACVLVCARPAYWCVPN